MSRLRPGLSHPRSHGFRRFPGHAAYQVVHRWPVDTNGQIESIEQRRRQTAGVPFLGPDRAPARSGKTALAAGTRVHGRDQEESGRERGRSPTPAPPDLPLLEWLTQGVEDDGRKLPHLVEEEHSSV